jgi:tetratricopeptide (TPR) repeat protein
MDKTKAEEFSKEGDKAYGSGDYKEAVRQYKRAVALDPSKPANHFGLGLAFFRSEDFGQAEGSFKRTLKLVPGFHDALYYQGRCLEKKGLLKEAAQVYESYLKKRPSDGKVVNRLGLTYFKLEENEKAYANLRRAIDLNAATQPTYFALGVLKEKEGKWEEALSFFDKASNIKSDAVGVWYHKGLCYMRLGQNDKALPCLEREVSLNPRNEDALYSRGMLLSDLEKYPDAIQCFNEVLVINPNRVDALVARGNAYSTVAQFERAVEDYQAAIRVDETYLPAIENLGYLFWENEQFDEALLYYREAYKLKPSERIAEIMNEIRRDMEPET